jgi:hypothetical protein
VVGAVWRLAVAQRFRHLCKRAQWRRWWEGVSEVQVSRQPLNQAQARGCSLGSATGTCNSTSEMTGALTSAGLDPASLSHVVTAERQPTGKARDGKRQPVMQAMTLSGAAQSWRHAHPPCWPTALRPSLLGPWRWSLRRPWRCSRS